MKRIIALVPDRALEGMTVSPRDVRHFASLDTGDSGDGGRKIWCASALAPSLTLAATGYALEAVGFS